MTLQHIPDHLISGLTGYHERQRSRDSAKVEELNLLKETSRIRSDIAASESVCQMAPN